MRGRLRDDRGFDRYRLDSRDGKASLTCAMLSDQANDLFSIAYRYYFQSRLREVCFMKCIKYFAFAALAVFWLAPNLRAVVIDWDGEAGPPYALEVAQNWVGDVLPGPDDYAQIDFGGVATVSADYPLNIQSLYIGAGSVTQTAGILNVDSGAGAGNPDSGIVKVGVLGSGSYDISSGTLNITYMSDGQNYGRVRVGDAGGMGVMKISGDAVVNSGGLMVGCDQISAPAGAVYQSGGTVTINGDGNAVYFDYGQMIGEYSYGYYGISNGDLTFSNGQATSLYIGTHGTGIFEQTGGTVTQKDSSYIHVGAGNGAGLMNLLGGKFVKDNNGWGLGVFIGWGAPVGTGGVVNLEGNAELDLLGAGTVKGVLVVGYGTDGIFNLGGNSKVNPGFIEHAAGGTGVFNFHGGTLIAGTSTSQDPAVPDFMGTLAHAYVYSEGAKISVGEAENAVISQALESPAGSKGLIDAGLLLIGGSGYIAPPLVTISGGGGTGATAYAVIDTATGVVTDIVVTNPGTGYTSAPSFNLTGGGGSGAAVFGDDLLSLADNVSGGLTKDGLGTLTLTGTNTYTGDTNVNEGVLDATTGINTPTATIRVADGATLTATSIVADTLVIGGAPVPGPVTPSAVPEPSVLTLLALCGLTSLGLFFRRKK
jgi:autotransporter-associated beta strand protein